MSTSAPPPNPHELLPPLLACLPTAAFSPRPPPALPPLLTPILRQRLHIFASSPAENAASWLKLLNWNRDLAEKLPGVVEQMNLEAHPVSGEIEIQEIEKIEYLRLDKETLHTRFDVPEFELQPTYLWCMADENNGGTGWRLAELRTLEDKDQSTVWYASLEEAEDKFKSSGSQAKVSSSGYGELDSNGVDDEEDDSAYWAAYDATPGRTPMKRSPAPASRGGRSYTPQTGSKAEQDYFERYMSEVQPAMDPYDADEDFGEQQESGLNHHRREFVTPNIPEATTSHVNGSNENDTKIDPVDLVISVPDSPFHPRPSSASSSRSVQALEAKAESQSHAELGIKQHISTDIKSLYRLARTAGITREEFERIVKTELEVLPLMDLE